MSEPDAASAGAKPAPSNLVVRVLAALVLAPLTIAIAYAGGWLWALLGILVALAVVILIVGLGGDESFLQNLIDTWNNFALSVQGWFK